ncbi:hypothetical protein [Actinokineospora inagensis]|uniref:hypothetical protein n=1 Tax=Actinokineospora inagensis TaxID=103730 RepID=UPI000418F557|nr:hypothetical protein [Actinokineospora inagensis]
MFQSLKIVTTVIISDDCAMTASTHSTTGQIDFFIGPPTTDGLEIGFDPTSLTRFIHLAQESLAKLNTPTYTNA